MIRLSAVLFAALFVVASSGTVQAADRLVGIVFFTEWSALLDAPAQQVVLDAKTVIERNPSGPVTVIGYADTSGSKEANDLLSQLRAQVVVDLLVADGVPAARLQRVDRGATPDIGGANESRRVDINVGSE